MPDTMTMGFKTRLHLNNKQQEAFLTWARARKRAFNFALSLCDIYLEQIKDTGEKNELIKQINQFDKDFNASKYPLGLLRKGKGGGLIGTGLNTWVRQKGVPSSACQIAIKYDLKSAWQRCFKKQGRQPRYQGKGRRDSFTLSSADLKPTQINHTQLTLPKGLGTARLGDAIPYHEYKLGNTAFTKEGDKWYVSFTLTIPAEHYYKHPNQNRQRIVGVDLGVKIYAAESNGAIHLAPEKLKRLEHDKAHINKKIGKTVHKNLISVVSKCDRCKELVKGIGDKKRLCKNCRDAFYPLMRSRQLLKLRASVSRISSKQVRIRENMGHQLTTSLVKRYEYIAIEDLKVTNMTKSSKGDKENPGKRVKQKSGLNRAILNVSPYRVRTMLNYKSERYGGATIAINPAYTSQTCSECGHTAKENRKSQANFTCENCGHHMNADTNAAINIKNKAEEKLRS